mmetsp:Transcript_31339/g.107747  ORF Transcript_31339/g.107747 Transcript_31339/m.107747 type:complete len:117 (-) Transcript_31339:63-413(-)
MEGGFPDSPPHLAEFMNFSAGFDPSAVAKRYGTRRSPDAFVRSCHMFNAKSWQSIFTRTFHGEYGVGSHDFSHGCCEGRLTWRLTGRLAPVEVRAFPITFKGPLAGARRMRREIAC